MGGRTGAEKGKRRGVLRNARWQEVRAGEEQQVERARPVLPATVATPATSRGQGWTLVSTTA